MPSRLRDRRPRAAGVLGHGPVVWACACLRGSVMFGTAGSRERFHRGQGLASVPRRRVDSVCLLARPHDDRSGRGRLSRERPLECPSAKVRPSVSVPQCSRRGPHLVESELLLPDQRDRDFRVSRWISAAGKPYDPVRGTRTLVGWRATLPTATRPFVSVNLFSFFFIFILI